MLSFHVHDLSRCGHWLLPLIRASKLTWAKQICYNADRPDWGFGMRIIARPWVGGDGVEHSYVAEGIEGAHRYWADHGSFIRDLAAWCYAVELPANEPAVGDHNQRRNLHRFTVALNDYYQAAEITGVVGNFPVGWPDLAPDALRELGGVFRAKGALLGLHHYGWPTLASADPMELYRYRPLRQALGDIGIAMPETILTEAGVDGSGTPMGRNGWRKAYRRFPDYLADLMAFNEELEKDGVCAAFLFDVGSPDRKWRTFGHEKAEVTAILQAQGLL